jgi:hypothetical protein
MQLLLTSKKPARFTAAGMYQAYTTRVAAATAASVA